MARSLRRCPPPQRGLLHSLPSSLLLGLQRCRLLGLQSGLVLGLLLILGAAPAGQAGLLRPVLNLMRPQLENHLTRICLEAAGGGDAELERTLRDPCRKIAGPTSRCLIEETDASGRGLGVLTEMLGGRFGDDSEVIVKRCLARMFGLPSDSLREVPLRELGRRFAGRLRPGDTD